MTSRLLIEFEEMLINCADDPSVRNNPALSRSLIGVMMKVIYAENLIWVGITDQRRITRDLCAWVFADPICVQKKARTIGESLCQQFGAWWFANAQTAKPMLRQISRLDAIELAEQAQWPEDWYQKPVGK